MNQFPFWDEYNYRTNRRGESAIFVRRLDPYKLESGWIRKWLRNEPIDFRVQPPLRPVPGRLTNQFETVTDLGVREVKLRDGRIFQRLHIFGCYNLK